MLRSTFYSFTTALRGLNTAQKQLDITGQNISNVGTYGYTRQRADVYSSAPGGLNGRYGSNPSTSIGQGSVISRISQSRDQFLDVRFRREAAGLGEEGTKLDTMDDLSMIFDEIEKGGLMNSFNDFVAKLQALSKDPQSPEFDSISRDAATTLIRQFKQYSKQLATAREEKEYNLKEVTVKSINDLLGNIAKLNESIKSVQSSGGPALELKDERNLLIDELSNYIKIDVKYSPKEVAGGIVVDDVTISMVGDDGSKQPLIYNDNAAIFKVKTKGDGDADRAVVTIDSSALPANAAELEINNLLKAISGGNAALSSLNDQLARLYPGNPLAVPPVPPVRVDGEAGPPQVQSLADKLAEVSGSISAAGGLNDQLAAATTGLKDAKKALKDRLADTVNPPDEAEKTALREAISLAQDEQDRLTALKTAAVKEERTLSNFNKTAEKHKSSVTNCDTVLRNKLAALGIDATLNPAPPAINAYGNRNYTFSKGGVPVLGDDGNPIQWPVGNRYAPIDRAALAEIGIVFDQSFDAEEFGSTGALKGAIDMLNSEGTFDYEANQVRGIGYYENMMDSLADKLATTLNVLNDKDDTAQKEFLFQTSDGSGKFTAANIEIAEGWLNGHYSITATKQPNAGNTNSGMNENILLMISTISQKMKYSTGPITNQDKDGNYLKTAADGTTSIVANGRDKDGNYTMDGVPVCNEDMVNFKTKTPFANIDADHYADNFNIYTRVPGTDIFKSDDGVTHVDKNGLVFKGDGTSGEYQLDASIVSPSDTSFFGKLPDGTYGEIANGKDANGNYVLNGVDTDGNPTSVIVANSDGVLYKRNADGSFVNNAAGEKVLDTAKVCPAYNGKLPDGTTGMVANGRDAFGNYTMSGVDASGKPITTIVANSDGVLYKKEADGSFSKDAEGNLILDAAASKLDAKPERFLLNGTFQEFLTNIGNVLALDISSTSNLVANHQTVLDSVQLSKDSISSVSLDEEGVNIMQFQKAYNAAARLMTALDEALERIINQMGTVGR